MLKKLELTSIEKKFIDGHSTHNSSIKKLYRSITLNSIHIHLATRKKKAKIVIDTTNERLSMQTRKGLVIGKKFLLFCRLCKTWHSAFDWFIFHPIAFIEHEQTRPIDAEDLKAKAFEALREISQTISSFGSGIIEIDDNDALMSDTWKISLSLKMEKKLTKFYFFWRCTEWEEKDSSMLLCVVFNNRMRRACIKRE